MDIQDTKKIVKILRTFYPNTFKSFSDEDYINLAKSYQQVFLDFNYEDIKDGLMDFVRTDATGFPPTPGRIIKNIYEQRDRVRKQKEAQEMKKWQEDLKKEKDTDSDKDWLKYENGQFVIVE